MVLPPFIVCALGNLTNCIQISLLNWYARKHWNCSRNQKRKRGNIKKSVYALSSRKPSQQMPSSSSPSWENSTYSIKMAFYISFRLFCRFLNGPLVQYKNKVIWLTGWLGHVGKNFLERRRKKKRKEFANTLICILKTFKRDLCLATYQTRLVVIC